MSVETVAAADDDDSTIHHTENTTMTSGVTRTGKTFLYMTGLCLACIAGYMYGVVDNSSYIAIVSPPRDHVAHSEELHDTSHDVSRAIQSSLPFGVCDGDDCTAIPAEDIKIAVPDEGETEVDKDTPGSRRANIRKVCRQYDGLFFDKISDLILKRLYVDEKDKVLYCSIPKAGCTSWKRVLILAANDSADVESISKDYAHHNGILRTLYDYPASERASMLENYRKFTFVRNPFIRLVSAFKDKFESLWQYREDPSGVYFRHYAADIMNKYRANVTAEELRSGENVTWLEFVLYVSHLSEGDFNEHWKPMYKLCAPCQIKYDFIGRMERIDDDFRYLQRKILTHAPDSFPGRFDLPQNSSEYTYEAYGEVTLQQLRQLWEIYKWDFWLFGYDKPDFI